MADPVDVAPPTGKWKAFLQENVAMGERDLYVRRSTEGYAFPPPALWYAVGFEWKQVERGVSARDAGIKPLVSAGWHEEADGMGSFLQAMLDVAWEAGMRPSGFADHTNELKAVRYHLEDMRTLVLKPLP